MRLLLRKIRNKLISISSMILIRLSLLSRMPWLTSKVLSLYAQKVNYTGVYTVLCLGRSIFMQDVLALAHFGKRIKYVSIHRIYWRRVFHFFLSAKEIKELTVENYHHGVFIDQGDKKYYKFLSKMLPKLQKMIGFDAILSGNLDYVDQQEIAQWCENTNVPFIVMHKEGMGAYGDYVDIEVYKTLKFIGARILFYNDSIHQAVLKLPLYNLPPEKAAVVGVPRFDFLVEERKNVTPMKQIVLFSFYPKDRFTALLKDDQSLAITKKRYEDFHLEVMRFAQNHSDFQVIIKTKLADHYYDYVKDIATKNGIEQPDNLIITNVGSSLDLVRESTVVLGFITTSLIEAVIAEKPIISPAVEDLVDETSWDFFETVPTLVTKVKTTDELKQKLEMLVRDQPPYDQHLKQKFLDRLVHRADGHTSSRVEQIIIDTIKAYQSK